MKRTSIKQIRLENRTTNQRLRRARRLYIFLNRKHIQTHIDLTRVGKAMQDAGLYSTTTPVKDLKFAVLRMLWRIEGGTYETWHNWRDEKGWSLGGYRYHGFIKKQA